MIGSIRSGGAARLGFGRGSLVCCAALWADHFPDALTEEQQRFLAEFGRWQGFGVSDRSGYRELLGTEITRIEPLRSPYGRTVGVILYGADAPLLRARPSRTSEDTGYAAQKPGASEELRDIKAAVDLVAFGGLGVRVSRLV